MAMKIAWLLGQNILLNLEDFMNIIKNRSLGLCQDVMEPVLEKIL